MKYRIGKDESGSLGLQGRWGPRELKPNKLSDRADMPASFEKCTYFVEVTVKYA